MGFGGVVLSELGEAPGVEGDAEVGVGGLTGSESVEESEAEEVTESDCLSKLFCKSFKRSSNTTVGSGVAELFVEEESEEVDNVEVAGESEAPKVGGVAETGIPLAGLLSVGFASNNLSSEGCNSVVLSDAPLELGGALPDVS